MVVFLAIHGTSGATMRRSSVLRSIHFAAGMKNSGTHALTVLHLNASTPSGPIACSGHARMHRSHPVHSRDSGFLNPFEL